MQILEMTIRLQNLSDKVKALILTLKNDKSQKQIGMKASRIWAQKRERIYQLVFDYIFYIAAGHVSKNA